MDNVWVEQETMWIGYTCPKCGHEGHEEVGATMMQGVCIEVHSHECEHCRFEVFDDYDEEDDQE